MDRSHGCQMTDQAESVEGYTEQEWLEVADADPILLKRFE